MKLPNKRGLPQITFNHSLDIDFRKNVQQNCIVF